MAVTSRFGKEIKDYQGGIIRKGRWISYKDYYKVLKVKLLIVLSGQGMLLDKLVYG